MKTDNVNLGKSFDKIKETIVPIRYSLTRLALTDQLALTKNDQPLMLIPEHLYEDFIYIISRSNAADKMFTESNPDDLKGAIPMDEVTQEIENELLKNKP